MSASSVDPRLADVWAWLQSLARQLPGESLSEQALPVLTVLLALALVYLPLMLLLRLFVFAPLRRGQDGRYGDEDDDVGRPSNTPALQRLWWRFRPPADVMRVDGLVLDRSRRPHAAWLGPTGAGKSSAVAATRVNGQRPTLIVTPDTSDPMRAAALALGGIVWTACESRVPINFLIGEPTEVAERLTEVFRSGGTGAWKRTARRATAAVIRDLDQGCDPRTLQRIGERLLEAVRGDRELRTVCAGWVERFLDLADQFGPSIAAEGLDIAEQIRTSNGSWGAGGASCMARRLLHPPPDTSAKRRVSRQRGYRRASVTSGARRPTRAKSGDYSFLTPRCQTR